MKKSLLLECSLVIFVFGVILVVFKSWFTPGVITAGDFAFYFKENLEGFFSLPYAWDNFWSPASLGAYRAPFLFSHFWVFLYGFLSKLGVNFILAQRLIWFYPFLILAIFSSRYLAKNFFPESKIFCFFVPLIYLLNTYALMIVGGGQAGIAMAYALAPLVFGLFINLINELKSSRANEFKKLVLAGVVLAIQVMFDPRVALITMGAVVLYSVFAIFSFMVPIVIAVSLHFYWLLPTILIRRGALPSGYGEPGGVEFLSFADFSNSISLLHPNWPENIFGKTYFMRPEFLLLPILAFSSLLFIGQLTSSRVKELKNSLINNSLINNKIILYFSFLGLLGAFLAKGSEPPFGRVYLWLFKYFPGMNLFRDPTKFYLLVALSYSILIPFSLAQIIKQLKKVLNLKPQTSNLKPLVLSLFILYWLFLIRPAWLGQLGGTFQTNKVPQEYLVLKDFINNQDEFFRTFWTPRRQRFGFWLDKHPALNADSFVSEDNCQQPLCSLKEKMPEKWGKDCLPNDRCYVRELSYFLNPQTAQIFSEMAIKYVIVPFDSEGEIFLAERKYNPQQRKEVEKFLDTISWLKKINLTEKIAVYETPSYKDHFFIADEGVSSIDWVMLNPTKYRVRISEATQPFKLVFSETYDEFWLVKVKERTVPSTLYNGLNSFTIDQTGDFEIVVEFVAQKYVYWGLVISGITLLICIWYLVSSIL